MMTKKATKTIQKSIYAFSCIMIAVMDSQWCFHKLPCRRFSQIIKQWCSFIDSIQVIFQKQSGHQRVCIDLGMIQSHIIFSSFWHDNKYLAGSFIVSTSRSSICSQILLPAELKPRLEQQQSLNFLQNHGLNNTQREEKQKTVVLIVLMRCLIQKPWPQQPPKYFLTV